MGQESVGWGNRMTVRGSSLSLHWRTQLSRQWLRVLAAIQESARRRGRRRCLESVTGSAWMGVQGTERLEERSGFALQNFLPNNACSLGPAWNHCGTGSAANYQQSSSLHPRWPIRHTHI